MAVLENRIREYELTLLVSLRGLDPAAFDSLTIAGSCSFEIAESLYDRHWPGHYLRRIKSVSLSIVVDGPLVPHCTLCLQKSCVRISPELRNGLYARDGDRDPRFVVRSQVIETAIKSGGLGDGSFESPNSDERYLPFEGAGAISSWSLSLPADSPEFDYSTIADVILDIHYTARDGGESLKSQVPSQ